MRLFWLSLSLSLLSACKNGKQEHKDGTPVDIDPHLSSNDTIRLLSRNPELKLFKSENIESKTRTAYIVQNSSFSVGTRHQTASFNDYKCKAIHKKDTLEIWLNNNNGYFGNGVLVQVFNNEFRVKDVNPQTLKNEVKFIKSNVLSQKLVLNKSNFTKNDSIYGFIDYRCNLESQVQKHFRGYFKTLIQ